MTSIAMIAGMTPMAVGLGDGAEQTAPLGIAVTGGLFFSTIAILFILPQLYHQTTGKKQYVSASLDPDDDTSNNVGQ